MQTDKEYKDTGKAKVSLLAIVLIFIIAADIGEVNPDLPQRKSIKQNSNLVIDTTSNIFVPESK